MEPVKNKKKIILIAGLFLLVVIVCVLIIFFTNQKTLTCIKPNDCSFGNCYNEYKFIGSGNIVKREERYAKIKDNERHEVIDVYYDMLKDNKEVYDLKIIDDTIEWRSKKSMVNSGYYDNCKDEKGNILFSELKKFYEKDGYTCSY